MQSARWKQQKIFTRLCKMNEIKIWGKCGLLCSPRREQNLYKGLVLHIYFVIVAMQMKNECTFILYNNLERCHSYISLSFSTHHLKQQLYIRVFE